MFLGKVLGTGLAVFSGMPRKESFMQKQHQRFLVAAAAAGLLLLGLAATVAAQWSPPLRLSAFAVNMAATRPAAQANIVEIQIDRWSSDQERGTLIDTLRTRGADKLLSALQRAPKVGFIRTPDSLAWDLHYARLYTAADGGSRIVLGTDRRLAFWELANNTRSTDYPFTVIEIHLDKNGKGEGRMSIATKVTADDAGNLHLENYSVEPVRLQNVQVRKD
jgi:hypothetical protein